MPDEIFDKIFDLMNDAKHEKAIEYINNGQLKIVDCCDINGTTPLQYAAFRGYLDLCKLLLSKGADVNAKFHDQGYSALMFAAIANKPDIVSLLLENDADPDLINSIGRTAVEMAAFVNSIESVDILKGFIPKKSLEYYTRITGISEKEPKLPKGKCFDELYALLTKSVNYSPIRILKAIMHSKVLFENRFKVISLLDAFITKSVKDTEDGVPKDILAFKLHFNKFIFDYLIAQKKILDEKKLDEIVNDEKLFDICIKRLVSEETVETFEAETNTKHTHMYRVFEEKFIRESIRKFPYPECAIVQQMVMVLSKTQVGANPSALKVITDCMNGQRMNSPIDEFSNCATCLDRKVDVKVCSHCKKVAYCDQLCQRMHWPVHKKES